MSKIFSFWEDYINMVLVLLQFAKAERTGNWKLHLSAISSPWTGSTMLGGVPVYLSEFTKNLSQEIIVSAV